MEARDEKTLEPLNESARFVIRSFQGTYSWIERECRQFWNDVMRPCGNDLMSVYFVGSIAYSESAHHLLLLVINQQQCSITAMRFPAVATAVKKHIPANPYFSSTMYKYFLTKPCGNVGCRFNPSSGEAGQQDLLSLVNQTMQPRNPSVCPTRNVGFFGRQIVKGG